MQELNKNLPIQLAQNAQGEITISARELYEFLEVKKDFSEWIKKMLDYGFIQGQDFVIQEFDYKGNPLPQKGESENQKVRVYKREYILTLDTAKEIAMIQRSDKGRQARQYFIAAEKQLKVLQAEQRLPEPSAKLQTESDRAKAFWAFADKHKSALRASHQSLYMSLLRYSEEQGGKLRFAVDWTVMMQYCGLSRNTYYKCMGELHRLGVIAYTKGINNLRIAEVELLDLSAAAGGAVPGATPNLFSHQAAEVKKQPKTLLPMPKEIIKIKFNEQEIKSLLAEHYGLKAESAELLFSYYQGSSDNDPSSVSLGIELSEQELKEIIAEKYKLKSQSTEIQISYDKSYGKHASKTCIIVEGEREEGKRAQGDWEEGDW